MNTDKNDFLEYRDYVPESILDFKGLRKSIKNFKDEQAVNMLMHFYEQQPKVSTKIPYPRFLPTPLKKNLSLIDTGTHNIGIFSTAICLETIAAYRKSANENQRRIDGNCWVWENKNRRLVNDRRNREISEESIIEIENRVGRDRRLKEDNKFGKEKAYKYFEFIINGLNGDYDVKFGFLAKIATLVRFSNYLNDWTIKEHFIEKADDTIKNKFNLICLDCINDFYDRLSTQKESIHPFELYRFLQFIEKWDSEIWNMYVFCATNKVGNKLLSYLKKRVEAIKMQDIKSDELIIDKLLDLDTIKKTVKNIIKFSDISNINEIHNIINIHRIVFDFFYDDVYFLGKYELYRQMSLKQSGDSKLYDVKRLIYALLIICLNNKFSNTLVRNKALDLIFSQYMEDKNAIWPTGQQVAMSKDGLMIVTDNECVCDLLECEALSTSLLRNIKYLKYIFDGYARTKKFDNGKITGWYPIHQRDKTPTSWTTALTLIFIKRFCNLISLELSRKAKERFRSNYRKPNIIWSDLYDSTAVKAKIRLMFPESIDLCNNLTDKNRDIIKECKYRTAILFGPPGTGKTTYGRALASKLRLDYLELTPGDFFAGGEDSILVTINDIFEHLLHLKNTVVFIDEIDDLVKDRDKSKSDDRRRLFVNSLLPRFQELHDNENIILLMATNNIEEVDKAITRMGRVDLVIPVGAISPHGRLKYFYKIYNNEKYNLSDVELENIIIDYLNVTEGFNYSVLKHFSEMVIDETNKIDDISKDGILAKLFSLFNNVRQYDSLRIRKDKVIKENNLTYEYDTRPKHLIGDFQDFGHFDFGSDTYPQAKRLFQVELIKLYQYLNKSTIDCKEANEIEYITKKYCNIFMIDEYEPSRKSKECTETFYNIMTPFYDDIEEAINRKVTDKNAKEKLINSKKEIMKLIYSRNMLTT